MTEQPETGPLARRAMWQMVLARGGTVVASVLGMAVLARLVGPAEFGIFASAMAGFFLAQSVALIGLNQYLVSAPEGVERDAGAAMGLTLTLSGVVLALGAGALAVLPAAWISGDLVLALAVIAPAVPFCAAAEVLQSLRRRAFDFRLIAWLGVGTALFDVGVAIGLAALGAGPVALAGGFVAGHAFQLIGLLLGDPALGRFRPRVGGWSVFLGFGGRMVVVDLTPRLMEIGVVAVVSQMLGMTALGLLNRARAVWSVLDRAVLEGIRPVILPIFASELRRGTPPRQLYLQKVDYLAAICWPGFALIGVLAEPLVAVLLGADWAGAVTPVRLLSLMGISIPFTRMAGKLYISLGFTQDWMMQEIFYQSARLGLVAIGALISLNVVCAGLALALALKAAVITRQLHRRIEGPIALAPPLLRGGFLTLGALVGPLMVLEWNEAGPVAALVLSGPLALAGWLVAALACRHRLAEELVAVLRRRAGLRI